ncbi:MAG: regulatory protein RecX [Nitrospiraceae bacterium]|nr:regulatory protein RecX [Nitrospiraceae bacterium]
MSPAGAFQHALKLLSYRSRSRAELAERLLRKGFTKDSVDAALQKLERLGYINDSALAAALERQARETRRLGRKGALGFLLKRGIPAGLAASALAGYDESEGAAEVARKKLRAMKQAAPEAARRRLYGALARRGYSAETIRRVFSSIIEEEDAP